MDLNFLFKDSLEKYYETIVNFEGEYDNDKLLFCDVFVKIEKIEIKLFEDYNKVLAKILLFDHKLKFLKKLTKKNELIIRVMKSNIVQYINNLPEIDFLTHLQNNFSNRETMNQNQNREEIYLNFFIDNELEKSIIINLNNIQINYNHNLVMILKTFFVEGLPNYENNSIFDFPNDCNINY